MPGTTLASERLENLVEALVSSACLLLALTYAPYNSSLSPR